MKIKILSVGKIAKSSSEDLLLQEYVKRTKWKINIIEIPDSQKENKKLDDASRILAEINKDDFVIALDERGDNLSSMQFKEILAKNLDIGKEIVFIIGGADGLDESVRQRANKLISFGKMTIPHKLVRVLLAEQIYRAYSIITNHPYHRE
ncbi:MAG: 23S rRNA (pseudouridine(1915)-N(3))-methyltransferase RlmH [Alphaproteobacteria bacterium]|nr:23S rRNA (pseudouridine(1915)-N(3))-methyltransferase RlmH [Alphaproteobacteria bacterium]OJV13575.1 MAG: hypothetical protein BGO27_03050 [Alphaproteobacteria bacterium 33-17]